MMLVEKIKENRLSLFILIVLTTIAGSSLRKLVGVDFKIIQEVKKYGTIELIVMGIFIAPIMEELAFRLLLIPKRAFISISASILSYMLANILDVTDVIPLYYKIPLSFLIGGIIYFINLESLFTNHKRLLFWLSAIAFGLIHITNYEISGEIILWSPLFFLGHVITGVLLGYTRVKFNMASCIIMHIAHNLFFAMSYIIIHKYF